MRRAPRNNRYNRYRPYNPYHAEIEIRCTNILVQRTGPRGRRQDRVTIMRVLTVITALAIIANLTVMRVTVRIIRIVTGIPRHATRIPLLPLDN